jgi:hypothetical protein
MDYDEFINSLVDNKWIKEDKNNICLADVHSIILPCEINKLCSLYSILRNPEDTVWFYSLDDYIGSSKSEFEWNYFEKNSLECAINESQRKDILNFWGNHIPFGASVVNGYSYIAFRSTDKAIVIGNEPEYEDSATPVAQSIERFFDLCISTIYKKDLNSPISYFLGLN